jgi:hypothetical protein
MSINDHGQVAGYYQVGTNNQITSNEAFVYSNGQYTTIDPAPSSNDHPVAMSINNLGQTVGSISPSGTSYELGFLATPTTGHEAIQGNTSLGQLVQAMASFSPTGTGNSSPLPTTQANVQPADVLAPHPTEIPTCRGTDKGCWGVGEVMK